MKCAGFFSLALIALACGRSTITSPVEKVVDLLKDLKAKVEQDGEAEQQIYDKYACFCDGALKGKADAIDQARATMRTNGQMILKLRGTIATLDSEIKELVEDIRVNEEMQAERLDIRTKENGAYVAETAEMKQALVALEQATIVLRDATQRTSLLQGGTSQSNVVKKLISILPASARVTQKQLSLLSSFMQTGDYGKYAPQSETIQGILQNMYQTFAADVQSATDAEATSNRDTEIFIELKQQELEKLNNDKREREEEKVQAETQLAEVTSLYDKTEAQMKADIEYFDDTKNGCEEKWAEWELRTKLRNEEIEGIDKALSFLTSDAARELFNSAIKPGKEVGADSSYDAGVSFMQLYSDDSVSTSVARAYRVLKAKASSSHSLRLAQLAVTVRQAKVGHFDKVIAAIDKMIAALNEENAADIDKRDQCKEQYQKIASTVADLEWAIKNNEAKIDKLAKIIETREEEKAQTIKDIKALEEQMIEMEKERKAENEEFLEHKKEDQAVIELLTKARAALSLYYEKNKIPLGPIQGGVKDLALSQREPEFEVSKYQAPDATFSSKGTHKGESKDIVSLMTYLIEDAEDEIRNAMKDEEQAQLDYEKSRNAAIRLKATMTLTKLELEKIISERTVEKNEEIHAKGTNKGELKDEVQYKERITPDCDWIIGAFATRSKQRTAELSALSAAKDYLAGANKAGLLQLSQKGFDDGALSNIRFLGLQA